MRFNIATSNNPDMLAALARTLEEVAETPHALALEKDRASPT